MDVIDLTEECAAAKKASTSRSKSTTYVSSCGDPSQSNVQRAQEKIPRRHERDRNAKYILPELEKDIKEDKKTRQRAPAS